MDDLLSQRVNAGFALARFAWEKLLVLHRARERARQRRALARLSDALLRDIGLTRRDVAREAAKPFWRP